MCQHPIKLRNPNYVNARYFKRNALGLTPHQSPYGAFIEVPCGHCLDCARSVAADFTYLAQHEIKKHKTNAFVTFTYDDEHVPVVYSHKLDEAFKTTRYADWTKFIKDLRRYCEYHFGIKQNAFSFFMCTEYGSKTHRPHMHALIHTDYFSLPELAELIRKKWTKGFVYVDSHNAGDGACAYVAKYMSKGILKWTNDGKQKDDLKNLFEWENHVLRNPECQLEQPRRRLSNFYGLPTLMLPRKNGSLSLAFDPNHMRTKSLLMLVTDPETHLPRYNTFYSFTIQSKNGNPSKTVYRNIPTRFLSRALNSSQKVANKSMNDYIRDVKLKKQFVDYVNNNFKTHFSSEDEILLLPDYKLYLDAFTRFTQQTQKESYRQAYNLHLADCSKEVIS